MKTTISITERDAATFKRLGGSKWLRQVIARARAVGVRHAADEAVCEYLEDFADEEIRDAVAGVEQCVEFEFEGTRYTAEFYLSSDSLVEREGQSLANAVDRAIRAMRVKILEVVPPLTGEAV